MDSLAAILFQLLENRSQLLRGHKVLADSDLADFYQVRTSTLRRAVTLNPLRFPDDLVFRLQPQEKPTAFQAGRYFFTGPGIAMLSTVLNSPRAIETHVALIRSFAANPQTWPTENSDANMQAVFDTLRQLLEFPQQGHSTLVH